MAEYRKDKGGRVFFRIDKDTGKVRKVSSKFSYVAIQDYKDAMFAEEALLDYEKTTELEFTEAFKEAKDRILLDRL